MIIVGLCELRSVYTGRHSTSVLTVCLGVCTVCLPSGLPVANWPHVNHLDIRHRLPQAADQWLGCSCSEWQRRGRGQWQQRHGDVVVVGVWFVDSLDCNIHETAVCRRTLCHGRAARLAASLHQTQRHSDGPTVSQLSLSLSLSLSLPRLGSGVVRIDPLRFLAGCRKRRLNQV